MSEVDDTREYEEEQRKERERLATEAVAKLGAEGKGLENGDLLNRNEDLITAERNHYVYVNGMLPK